MDFTSLTKFSPTEYTPDNKFRPTLPTFARKKMAHPFLWMSHYSKLLAFIPGIRAVYGE